MLSPVLKPYTISTYDVDSELQDDIIERDDKILLKKVNCIREKIRDAYVNNDINKLSKIIKNTNDPDWILNKLGKIDQTIVDYNSSIKIACDDNNNTMLKIFIENRKHWSKIPKNLYYYACDPANESILYLLVDMNINIDEIKINALDRAIYYDDICIAKDILSSGIKLENNDDNYQLICCIENGSEQMVKLLLDYDADPNLPLYTENYSCPIVHAYLENRIDIANILLNAGAIIPTICIKHLSRMPVKIIRMLLNSGIQYKMPSNNSVSLHSSETVKLFYEYNIPFNYNRTLADSMKFGNFYVVQSLIDCGMVLDNTSMSKLLYNAIKTSNYIFIKYALDHGAKISDLNVTNTLYFTIDTIKYLINNGVNVNEICMRCRPGDYETIQFLIDCGANIYDYGEQLFIIACKSQQINIIKLLIQTGVPQSLLDTVINGSWICDNVVQLLITNGAQYNVNKI